eukprot:m.5499 g.5499  ORF g.5499 m.5499 type:complete len:199 (-) comp4311_c0_seq1:78-674(-)
MTSPLVAKALSPLHRMVWVDLEMTGLNINHDRIIEMAVIVTESDLSVVAEAETVVIHQSDTLLDGMDEWCTEHHGASGLTQRVKDSKITEAMAERRMLEFIQEHVPKGACPLAGNSVHADKMFLDKYMPSFMDHLHYRIVDVSSFKEVIRRWQPDVLANAPPKMGSHRALDDIKESITELQYYKSVFFTTSSDGNSNK